MKFSKNIIKKKNLLTKYLLKNTKNFQKYFKIFSQFNNDRCNNWMQLLIIKNNKIKINKLLELLNQKNIQSKRAWSNINKFNYLKNFHLCRIKVIIFFQKLSYYQVMISIYKK